MSAPLQCDDGLILVLDNIFPDLISLIFQELKLKALFFIFYIAHYCSYRMLIQINVLES